MFKGLACSFLFSFYATFHCLADGGWVVVEVSPSFPAVKLGDFWGGVSRQDGEDYYYGNQRLWTAGGIGTNCVSVRSDVGGRDFVSGLNDDRQNGIFGLSGGDSWFRVKWLDSFPSSDECYYVSAVSSGYTGSFRIGDEFRLCGVFDVGMMGVQYWWGDEVGAVGSLLSFGFGSSTLFLASVGESGGWAADYCGPGVVEWRMYPGGVVGDDYFVLRWGKPFPVPPPDECYYVSAVSSGYTGSLRVGDEFRLCGVFDTGVMGFQYWWGDEVGAVGSLLSFGFGSSTLFLVSVGESGGWAADYCGPGVVEWRMYPGGVVGDDYFVLRWGKVVWPFVIGEIFSDFGKVQWYVYDARGFLPIPLYTFEGTNFHWSVTGGVYLVSARISLPDITDEIFSEPFTVGGLGWSTNIVLSYYVTNSVTLKFYGQYGTPLGGAMIEIFRRSSDYVYVPPPYPWFSYEPDAIPPPDWYPAYFAPGDWYFWDNVSTVDYLRTLPDGSVSVTLPDGVYLARCWDNRLKTEVVKEFRVGDGYFKVNNNPYPSQLVYSFYTAFNDNYIVWPDGVVCKFFKLKADSVVLDYNGLDVGQPFEVWGSCDLLDWEFITDMEYFGAFEIPRRSFEERYFWKIRTY